MYDAGKIITGVVIALLLLAFPIIYTVAYGNGDAPTPVILPEYENETCIESVESMREDHMKLLDSWRDTVVRDANRIYEASDGTKYYMGLSAPANFTFLDEPHLEGVEAGACLICHPNKSDFCDSCHDYSGINPSCWNCHIETVQGDE